MNERIEQLATQLAPVATIGNWGRVEWVDGVYPQIGDKMYADIDLQKFAKLFVNDCVNTCIEKIKYRVNQFDMDEFEARCVIADIKKEFGIE